MSHSTSETDDAFSNLLEFAANNDLEGFKRAISRNPSGINEIGLWYSRHKGSKQMVYKHRTPLMVASTYGSIDVMKLILSQTGVDVNRRVGLDNCTALHCAASGGAANAVEVVKLLLESGADPSLADANGHSPVDNIVVPPRLKEVKLTLVELLTIDGPVNEKNMGFSDSPPIPSSPDSLDFVYSPTRSKYNDFPTYSSLQKKEYPIDPSLPDIKNNMYSTDEFRMYSFKVRPCSRAYSHDWTECPFVHPGENARRRDPRKFHYSCFPCLDFRRGTCRQGDMCEYAHGVFESWLHPAQYRTRLCKDGRSCSRRVCFFAHTPEELRPLYVSTDSSALSPSSGPSGMATMDYATTMNHLLPNSPSSFTPPMSLSANNGMSQHSSIAWPQQNNVPSLHLPGSTLQWSRLRSSLNARDIPFEDFDLLKDFDAKQQQLLNEFSCLSHPSLLSNSLNRSGRFKTTTPSNIDDHFSGESSSPRYSDQALASAVLSPTHKSAVLNQFRPQQSMLSPINTNFSPKNVDHPLLQASFGIQSPGRMSPRNGEPISPISSRMSMLARREKLQQFRSLSSRELGGSSFSMFGSPIHDSWSKCGSSNGDPDWAVNSLDGLGRLRRSSSFELGNNGEEPDLSWVQSLVKDLPTEMKEEVAPPPVSVYPSTVSSGGFLDAKSEMESSDQAVLGAWLEQMQLDQLVVKAQSRPSDFSGVPGASKGNEKKR